MGYKIVHCIMMMCTLQAVVFICHMGHQMNVPRIKGTSYIRIIKNRYQIISLLKFM